MIDLTKERQLNLLKEISKCRSIDNNCDYLLEHSDCDYLIDYINYLQQENKELKEELRQIKTEPLTNRISRIDSVVANIYREKQQLDLYKSVLDEIREYIEKHKMIACDEFEYISTSPDIMLQILDKATEQKW